MRRLGRTLLIFVPLIICVVRLHAGKVGTPMGVTQEVARCLTMVRVAAARRTGREAPAAAADQRRSCGESGAAPLKTG